MQYDVGGDTMTAAKWKKNKQSQIFFFERLGEWVASQDSNNGAQHPSLVFKLASLRWIVHIESFNFPRGLIQY